MACHGQISDMACHGQASVVKQVFKVAHVEYYFFGLIPWLSRWVGVVTS